MNFIVSVAYVEADADDQECGISFTAHVLLADEKDHRIVFVAPVLGPLSDARRSKISEALAHVVPLLFDGDDEGPIPLTPLGKGVQH